MTMPLCRASRNLTQVGDPSVTGVQQQHLLFNLTSDVHQFILQTFPNTQLLAYCFPFSVSFRSCCFFFDFLKKRKKKFLCTHWTCIDSFSPSIFSSLADVWLCSCFLSLTISSWWAIILNTDKKKRKKKVGIKLISCVQQHWSPLISPPW